MKNPRSILCKTSIMASSDVFNHYGDKFLELNDSGAFDQLVAIKLAPDMNKFMEVLGSGDNVKADIETFLATFATSSSEPQVLENYKDELEEMKNMSRQEYVAHLRRKSSGFSRGASMYRGVTRSCLKNMQTPSTWKVAS